MVKVSASVLSAPFDRLGAAVSRVSKYVDELHLDIMDGHFVPNISFGPDIVKVIRKKTDLPLDVHLMIEDPMKYIDKFVDAGADMITFHYETANYFRCRDYIKSKNVKVGVAYNPNTPAYILDSDIDRVLIMSVYPGFAGQKFIASTLGKISKTKDWIEKRGYNIEIAVDGGVNKNYAHQAVRLGVDVVIAGSYIFKNNKLKKNVSNLKKRISIVDFNIRKGYKFLFS